MLTIKNITRHFKKTTFNKNNCIIDYEIFSSNFHKTQELAYYLK